MINTQTKYKISNKYGRPGHKKIVSTKLIRYHLLSDDLKKTEIDLLKLIKSSNIIDHSSAITSISVQPSVSNNQKNIAFLRIGYEEGEAKYILNIDSLKIENNDKINAKYIDDTDNYQETSVYLGINNILQKKYGVYETSLYGARYLDSYNDKVNLSTLNIADEQPEITKILESDGAIYPRPGYVTGEEWFDTILHWFAPQGQDVMELYATDSNTGEKTQIKSYQDYETWRQIHLQD